MLINYLCKSSNLLSVVIILIFFFTFFFLLINVKLENKNDNYSTIKKRKEALMFIHHEAKHIETRL